MFGFRIWIWGLGLRQISGAKSCFKGCSATFGLHTGYGPRKEDTGQNGLTLFGIGVVSKVGAAMQPLGRERTEPFPDDIRWLHTVSSVHDTSVPRNSYLCSKQPWVASCWWAVGPAEPRIQGKPHFPIKSKSAPKTRTLQAHTRYSDAGCRHLSDSMGALVDSTHHV